ncbi:hypothetical protein, partial [Lentzea sp.]|uniref:hypothetical protein n=1 Tax=Lentzea sp. TaxID=56099 RepID=UPI002ED26827
TVTRGDLGLDLSTITSVLRYHHVSQRAHGLAGHLAFEVSGEAEDMTMVLLVQAMRFIAGHELVHHAFGHTTTDRHQEYQADAGAHMTLVRMGETGPRKATSASVLALWGGLVAVLAVHSAEKALFIRCGASHPPALDRVHVLLAQVDQNVRRSAEVFLRPLLTATDAAAVFAEGAEVFDSSRVLSSPMISSPLSASYLRSVEILDAAMCCPPERLVAGMSQGSVDGLGEGARLASAGRAAEAQHRWGVRDDVVRRLVDPL